MDPNRHHDSTYLARNNDERTRAVYTSRGTAETTRNGTTPVAVGGSFDDVRSPHLQYYTSNRDLLAKKPAVYGCTCSATNPMCNSCRAAAAAATSTTTITVRSTTGEDNWTSAAAARQSPIYINTTNQHHLQHNNNHHHMSNNSNNSNNNSSSNSNTNTNNNNTNTNSRRGVSYWPPEEQHFLHKDQLTVTTYLDARKPPTLTESNYTYKQVPTTSQHQQSITTSSTSIQSAPRQNAINHYTSKEQRYYDEVKYAMPSVVLSSTPNLKIGNYSSSSGSGSIYDRPTTTTHSSQYTSGTSSIDHHQQSTQRTVRTDHIVNPSNTVAPKEQQPSPNYGRKCPQIYGTAPPEREQHATAHRSLYMDTPQFSSEKFQTIAQSAIHKYTRVSATPPANLPSSQQQQPIDAALEYRRSSSAHVIPEHITSSSSSSTSSTKMRVDSPQPPIPNSVIGGGGGGATAYKTTSSHKYAADSQRNMYSNVPLPPQIGTVNYYGQSNHLQQTPLQSTASSGLEVTAVIMKTTPQPPSSHYVQYSKSPLPQSAQYHNSSSNESRRDNKVNYMKLENEPPAIVIFEPHAPLSNNINNPTLTASTRGLYHNPYITPPTTENCCTTERASPYGSSAGSNSTANSYRGESPHGYPTKYGKLVQETISMHKLNNAMPTPPPSAPGSQGKSSHISRSQSIVTSATPARSHSASNSYYYGSPSPAAGSAASPSPQMHHTVYTPTPPPPPLSSAASPSTVVASSTHQTQAAYNNNQQQQQPAPIILPQGYAPSGDIYSQSGLLLPKNISGSNSSSISGSSGKQPLQIAKKLQAPKPNYRELINELMMRNTASEEELNLQIIKKTLNVNTPPPPPPHCSSGLRIIPNHTGALVVTPPANHHHASSGVIHQPASLTSNVNHAISTTTPSIVVPHIKQEIVDKPPVAAYSPLDLSMRTVKTKADSTEYKYRHTNSVDYKHGLPRFDITPNFSAATVAQRLSTQPSSSNNSSRHEQKAYTPSVREPTSSSQQAYRIQQVSPQPGIVQQAPTSSLVIKTSAPRQHEVALAQSARPSVLVEPNPYPKVVVATPQPSRQLLACEQLPPDTSIVVLPKLVATNNQQSSNIIGMVPVPPHEQKQHQQQHQPLRSIQPTQSAYSSSSSNSNSSSNHNTNFSNLNNVVIFNEQKNPNYLGRKRHLQEYSNANTNTNNKYHINNNNNNNINHINTQEPYNKKKCVDLPAATRSPLQHNIAAAATTIESHPLAMSSLTLRAAEIPVIAINEHALELELRRTANEKFQPKAGYIGNRETPPSTIICKQEPLTPTSDIMNGPPPLPTSSPLPLATIVPIKAERIRTKAELKGFTFNPPPEIVDSSTNNNNNSKIIKIEPEPVEEVVLPNIPGLNDEFNEGNLLDFGWSNTCNSFVEQLLTSNCSKKQTTDDVTVIQKVPPDIVKQEISEDDLPVAHIIQRKFNNTESALSLTSAIVVSTTTTGGGSGMQNQKKLSRMDREKKRFVQEQRIAARLPDGSSSESDNELDKRKSERQKKPLRKTGKSRKQMQHENTDDKPHGGSSYVASIYSSISELTDDAKESPASKTEQKTNRKQATKRVRVADNDDDDDETDTTAAADASKKQSATHSKEKRKFEEKSKKSETSASSASQGGSVKGVKSNKVQYSTTSKTSLKVMSSTANEKKSYKSSSVEERKPASSSATSTLSSKKKLQAKIALNTMTRSKRKKELEMQLANSKVLRNDKIIRNSTTKIKRKYVRKLVAAKEAAAAAKDANIVGTRLRARKVKEMPMNGRKMKRKNDEGNAKAEGTKKQVSGEQNAKATTGNVKSSKTQQQDLYMDLYRFKRALKIPPKLISLENMNHHKIAASLPDLERGNAMEELKGFKNAGKRKTTKTLKTEEACSKEVNNTTQPKEDPEPQFQPKSIIDLLHSRVTNISGGGKILGNATTTSATTTNLSTIQSTTTSVTLSSKAPSVVLNFSETSQNTESTSVYELPLPTPVKNEDDDSDAKRHFSIFDTKVLQSKTRTESKLQQRREKLREIFVGPDRPASAPPLVPQADDALDGGKFCTGDAFMSYKKCEQFLEQMNIILNQKESKFSRIGSGAAKFLSKSSVVVKKEEDHDDIESASAIDPDEKHDNVCINTNSTTGVGHLHRRRGKYIRRKGSSGFDYIRKKKKPATTSSTQQQAALHQIGGGGGGTSGNAQQQQQHNLHHHWHSTQIKIEKHDEDTEMDKTKTEDDVCREIQKWVLNKGVGQSTMHKAARQGYIDVMVYCLDHMGMNPNQKDNAGYTPLHEACTQGWLEIARILLQFGANHSEAAQAGIRPLHGAIENDHEEVVRLLLSYGADPLLATYSGQTPLMLASSRLMRGILNTHLSDAQSEACNIRPIQFPGPWEIFDRTEYGYDIFDNVPNIACDKSKALRRKNDRGQEENCRRTFGEIHVANTNGFLDKKSYNETSATITTTTTTTSSSNSNSNNHCSNGENITKTVTATTMATTKLDNGTGTTVAINNNNNISNGNLVDAEHHHLHHHDNHHHEYNNDVEEDDNNNDNDGGEHETMKKMKKDNDKFKENSDSFEFEEADVLLPPLYLLKDEGSEKWVLLNDLCNLLKVKSKDTLLNKICPGSTTSTSTMASAQKNLLREYKLSDFLEKATCLQLLCAGEKLNIGASKVVLIKYNESVKNLLGVKTILMQF